MENSLHNSSAIQSFKDLIAWKKGHAFVLNIYEETRIFPREEMFGLVSQLRRAAVSITSNIAEGFRKRSRKEKQHFYDIAMGSLTEIQNQLLIAHDVGHLPKNAFLSLSKQAETIGRILHGLAQSAMTHAYP
jgi:four helix bundle protein